MASHLQPAQLYTFTASIKNTSSYTQHLHYHTTELLLGRRDFSYFFFFYLRRRNPFTRRYNAPCTAFPSRRAPPTAWSCRVWVIWPSVSLRFSFSAACLSGLSALVSALRPPACRAGSSRHALVLYSHRHSLCNLLFVLADVLLMSVPLNVIIAHL